MIAMPMPSMMPASPGMGGGGGRAQIPPDLQGALAGLQDPMAMAMMARDAGGYGGQSPLVAALLGLLTNGGSRQMMDNPLLQALLGGQGGGGGSPMAAMGMPGMMGSAGPPPAC